MFIFSPSFVEKKMNMVKRKVIPSAISRPFERSVLASAFQCRGPDLPAHERPRVTAAAFLPSDSGGWARRQRPRSSRSWRSRLRCGSLRRDAFRLLVHVGVLVQPTLLKGEHIAVWLLEEIRMRAIDAMIVWTPNRDLWLGRPATGEIAVTTIPEHPSLKRHPMSVGACDLNWRETDDEGRRELMQKYFTQMIHRDHLDETAVRSAIAEIDEFKKINFSAEKPAIEDE